MKPKQKKQVLLSIKEHYLKKVKKTLEQIAKDKKNAALTKVGNKDFIRGYEFGVRRARTDFETFINPLILYYGTPEQDKIENVETEQKV